MVKAVQYIPETVREWFRPPSGQELSAGAGRKTIRLIMIATTLGIIPAATHNILRGNLRAAAALGFACLLLTTMALLGGRLKFEVVTEISLWGLLATISFLSVTSPFGIHSTSIVGFPGLLVVAAMTMSGRRYAVFAVVSTTIVLSIAVLDWRGMLTQSISPGGFAPVVDIGIIVVITAAACGFLSRNMREAIEHSRHHSRLLADRNALIDEQRKLVVTQKSEIVELLRRSEEASRLKSEFLANMSHEVRTPMNAIIGMAQLALSEGPEPAHREYLNTIVQSGEGLMVIMNDILDLSKIEAGHLSVTLEPFDLRRTVEGTIRLLRLQAEQKGLSFGFSIGEDCPTALEGDADRLRQVLVNLLGNAVKFTESGRVWLDVGGAALSDGQWRLRFDVIDDGPGIPDDQLEMIFDPFRQADGSARRRQGGTGLGLTISEKIARRLGGRIRVRSKVGVGSTFTLEVPFRQVSVEAVFTASEEPAGHCHRSLKVLVAEDNAVNQLLASRMLERLGHSVTVVPDGLRAVRLAEAEDFDLIFMDVQMPHMDGYEAARTIRAGRSSAVPIIAMTAHAMAGDREACLAAGMTDYVSKPITFESLAAAIDRTCGPRRQGPIIGETPSATPTSAQV